MLENKSTVNDLADYYRCPRCGSTFVKPGNYCTCFSCGFSDEANKFLKSTRV
uniref:Uncharacterized protein n=1 Tax=viral metagenome TaxID=1070528 RepID=A0A6H1ZH56_9ZZZZ